MDLISGIALGNAAIAGVGAYGAKKASATPNDERLQATIDKLQREIEVLKKAKEICESKKVAEPVVVPGIPVSEPVAPVEPVPVPEPVAPVEPVPVTDSFPPEPVEVGAPEPVLKELPPLEPEEIPEKKRELPEDPEERRAYFTEKLSRVVAPPPLPKPEVPGEYRFEPSIESPVKALTASVPRSNEKRPPAPPLSTRRRRRGGLTHQLRKKKLRTRRGGKQKNVGRTRGR